MYMIKSYGGSGSVSDVVLENFIGHGNAYSLDIDQYWSSMDPLEGDGVQLRNIKISNWTGGEANGLERGPIKVMCADGAPCTGIDITDFAMWTESGDSQWYSCQSAYTDVESSEDTYCLQSGEGGSYAATTTTVNAAPTGYGSSDDARGLERTHLGYDRKHSDPNHSGELLPWSHASQCACRWLAGWRKFSSCSQLSGCVIISSCV